MIKAYFFDVANTLLHKPSLFIQIQSALNKHSISIDASHIQEQHKLLSEVITFPDKTSSDFYSYFNKELLYSLGVIPTKELLEDVFEACTYLPWHPFEDTEVLESLATEMPIGIISNWDASLPQHLSKHFSMKFDWVLCSQLEGVRKPKKEFFQKIMDSSGLEASEIIYVGDSIKLDIEPALEMGIQAVLIDRKDTYPFTSVSRINDLRELLR